jgi:hypothetical protein
MCLNNYKNGIVMTRRMRKTHNTGALHGEEWLVHVIFNDSKPTAKLFTVKWHKMMIVCGEMEKLR